MNGEKSTRILAGFATSFAQKDWVQATPAGRAELVDRATKMRQEKNAGAARLAYADEIIELHRRESNEHL